MLIRLAIAVVVAVVVSGFYHGNQTPEGGVYILDLTTMLSFAFATIITVLLGHFSPSAASDDSFEQEDSYIPPSKNKKVLSAEREEGTVKWFNVSKGFGFINRPNGEEVFVHYRSIRGHGRRRLFEDQVVSFIIIDSDKGPQADDVEIIR